MLVAAGTASLVAYSRQLSVFSSSFIICLIYVARDTTATSNKLCWSDEILNAFMAVDEINSLYFTHLVLICALRCFDTVSVRGVVCGEIDLLNKN